MCDRERRENQKMKEQKALRSRKISNYKEEDGVTEIKNGEKE